MTSYLGRWGRTRGVGRSAVHSPGGFNGSPDCQPVVNGNNDGVLEELGGHHQEDHEEAPRGHVAPAHLGSRRDLNIGHRRTDAANH